MEQAVLEIQNFSGNKNVDFLLADLFSMKKVKHLVNEFKSKFSKLDILINNAGVYLPDKIITTEALETTMATNYFSPFYLTSLLFDNLNLSEQVRVINVSSGAYTFGKIDLNNFNSEQNFSAGESYCNSKLALNYFTVGLAKRLQDINIRVNAFNPGKVATKLNRHLETQPSTNLPQLKVASGLPQIQV